MTSFYRIIIANTLLIVACSTVAAESETLATLDVPDGFEVTEAVAPGLTVYPMFMAFDDVGRLFIAESTGKDLSGQEMAAAPECQILRLEDTDGDSVYDTRTIFAEELSLPMGVLWHQNALFVASPPDLIRFDDNNGDGIADNRTVLLSGWNVLNTASLHGPFLGPDGRLYLTHGRHGYNITTKEGTVLEGLAARIWSCNPDGTDLERFAGGGFDNPVEVVFTETGQMLGTMTYYTDPRHGQRDALMHWVRGGVYPKPHDSVSEFVQTGPLMPVMSKFARIAPAGLALYESSAFGDEYQGALFSAQFNPHRIQMHTLSESGSTFTTVDTDFLTSTSSDFYPTDVLEDADGSLLVSDTGAWYVDACPISRIAKPEIKGAIYRIRKTGADVRADPWGREFDVAVMSPDQLVDLLHDARFRLRERAREELVKRGDAAKSSLRAALEHEDPKVRRTAVWVLYRVGENASAIQSKLNDTGPTVRIAAIQALGMSGEPESVTAIIERLKSASPIERREAATALGKLDAPQITEALLDASAIAEDRFEEHAIRYALIENGDPSILLKAVDSSPHEPARAAALVGLDQRQDPGLNVEHVLPFLRSDSPPARQTGLWVASHHPEWSETVLAYVANALDDAIESDYNTLQEILLAYAGTSHGQEFVTTRLLDGAADEAQTEFLLNIVDTAALTTMPPAWENALRACLTRNDSAAQWHALGIAGRHRIENVFDTLAALADDPNQAPRVRLAALSPLVADGGALAPNHLALVLQQFAPEADAALRQTAASILARAAMDADVKRQLADKHLPSADALATTTVLAVFEDEADTALQQAFAHGLSANPQAARIITMAQLDRAVAGYSKAATKHLASLRDKLEARDGQLMERFLRLEPVLGKGDVGRGRATFFSEQAQCSTCHAIGGEGGLLGPDLTAIGLVRSGHDLLESIMFPSSSAVPDFQAYTIETGDETLSGVIARETPTAITFYTSAQETRTIARTDIAEMKPAPISMMPEGLEQPMSDQQLLDLVAFLMSLNNEQWLMPDQRN